MLQRVITGAAIAVAIIAILFSNYNIVATFVSLLVLIAQFEMSNVVGFDSKPQLKWCNLVFSVFFSLIIWFNITKLIGLSCLIYVLTLFAIMIFAHKKIKFSDVVMTVFCMIYITVAMLHITAVRKLQMGDIYIFLVFIGAFATDTCAYFVGVLFGKHKLCPEISPKKTIEGAIGGEVGTILLMLAFGYVVTQITGFNVNYVALVILGIISGLVSQLGDLTASVIKREFGVKDYGHILPGHGGVMDRIDSIILMAPLIYYFVAYVTLFSA